jgi:hypothetical protein
VFTVLPHFVLRYHQMRPEVARDALLATHGGLSLELCTVLYHLSPMALSRLVCAFGHHSLVTVLTRCGLPLPVYFLADEKHSRCLTDKVYVPTIVCGRVLWHLGYIEAASMAAFTQSYREFQQAALQQEPSYRVRGILTDGFDSTTSSMRTLFPGALLGNCLRHAINKLPSKLVAIASPVRKALRSRFHTLPYRARQRKGLRVFALGQRLRHFADHVAATAGSANGERVRRWMQEKKAGWYAVLAAPQMPVTSTLLDQAHNAIERKLFTMKGFHHPGGSQQAFVTGLAHLYNLIPYQHRAKHAGQCGVAVEGGQLPTPECESKEAPCCLSTAGFIPALTRTGQAPFSASGGPTPAAKAAFSHASSPCVVAASCCPSGFGLPGMSRPLPPGAAFLCLPGRA